MGCQEVRGINFKTMIRELRLGNIIGWIDRNHEVHIPITSVPKKVYQISIHECLVYKHDLPEYQVVDEEIQKIKFTDIYGIPLTEKWITRFGFKEVENVDDGVRIYENDLRDQITFDINGYFYQWPSKYVGEIRVSFVHQLQNLYFALNEGKELTLKTDEK